MTARANPCFFMFSWNAWASSGGIGFVLRSIRGLREKIWIVSQPTLRPRDGASAMLSEIETWAPSCMRPPPRKPPHADELCRAGTRELFHRVGDRSAPGLHDQIRQGEVRLSAGE